MRRLYNAVCGWLEADAAMRTSEHEPQAEGNNFTQAERVNQPDADELHAGHRHQSIDDDDSGAYRIGFTSQRVAIYNRNRAAAERAIENIRKDRP